MLSEVAHPKPLFGGTLELYSLLAGRSVPPKRGLTRGLGQIPSPGKGLEGRRFAQPDLLCKEAASNECVSLGPPTSRGAEGRSAVPLSQDQTCRRT